MLRFDGTLVERSGGVRETTNNRMELTAVIQALEHVLSHSELKENVVDLYTDSMYVKKGITEWINSWLANGWRSKARKPVKNKELWQKLLSLTNQLEINWNWTPGHRGIDLNERCDRLVHREIEKIL